MQTYDTPNIISYGGGVQSTALIALSVLENIAVDEIIHVDLMQAESPATREYVAYIRNWLAERNIQMTIIERDLYQAMLDNPSFAPAPFLARDGGFILSRQCTRQFKIAPIRAHIRARYPKRRVNVWLGISVDEYHRMRDSDVSYITHCYPLIDRRLTRNDCRDVIKRAGLRMPEKSSCWFCPFRRATEQSALVARYPHLAEMAQRLEDVINADRARRGKDEIIVLKTQPTNAQQLDLLCDQTGWCVS